MKYGYDKTNWPIVILTAEGYPENESQMSGFLHEWGVLYSNSSEKNAKFKLFIDIRSLDSVDVKYLIMIAQFLVKSKKQTETWMDRTGILVSSGIIKQLLDFVFSIYKPIRPFKIFNDATEAMKWVINNESWMIEDSGYDTDESIESDDESEINSK